MTTQHDISNLRNKLRAVDPDIGYDDWIRVGRQLHAATDGCTTGLAIWDRWSRQSSKYPGRHELMALYRGFRQELAGQRAVALQPMYADCTDGALDRLTALCYDRLRWYRTRRPRAWHMQAAVYGKLSSIHAEKSARTLHVTD